MPNRGSRRIMHILMAGGVLLSVAALAFMAGRKTAAPDPAPLACRPSAPVLAAKASGAERLILMLGNSQLHDHDWVFPGSFVVNCARQGLPAHVARPLLPGLPDLKPDTIIVAFGAVELQRAGLKSQPLDQAGFAETLHGVVSDLQARWPDAGIVLAGIPPMRPGRFPPGREPDSEMRLTMNRDLAAIARASGKVRFSDPDDRLPVDAGGLTEAMTHDGLHLTPAAYALWQEQLWAVAMALDEGR
ncbi:MAG: SGNH/GDSL hydrolase family protein [Pseudomonadota bacterium]